MEKTTIPGAPSWYLSQVLDCSWDNRLAYGSLMHLVIISPSDPENPVAITNAHGERISSVSFAPKSFGNYLLTTCAGGISIIWDLNTYKSFLVSKIHKEKIVYGNWSHACENLVVCADEHGGVSRWDVKSSIINHSTFPGFVFNIVACCPHNKELVALGTKQGTTCIVSLNGNGSIIHKIPDHSFEVVSIVWCPVAGNIMRDKQSKNDYILCSASRDKSVHFWKVGKDIYCEARVELPSTVSVQKIPGNSRCNWTCLSWPSPSILLASAIGGEVFSIKVEEINTKGAQLVGRAASREKKANWTRVFTSVKHGRGHVTIHSCPWGSKKPSEKDWQSENVKEDGNYFVWTSSSDRLIYGIDMKNGKENKVNVKINTFGGVVYALAVSPIDGHSLAIGVADKSIRLVNLSEPNFSNMRNLFIKYNAKVMALSWHPVKEDWLAYGTSDGHVDIYSVRSNKLAFSFKQHTRGSIYVLQWGPCLLCNETDTSLEPEEAQNKLQLALFCVGDGKVAMFNPDISQNPDLKSVDPLRGLLLDETFPKKTPKITDLSWKPDYSMLAVGNDKGSIFLFYLNSHQALQLLSCVTEHVTLIQDLAWHPPSCTLDVSESSPYSNWLASASNDEKVRVLDVSAALTAAKAQKSGSEINDLKVPCIATLSGHKMRVVKVAWSPHQSGQLVSASYDQCVQVWDVPKQEPLACFVGHDSPVLTCLWSPVKAEFVLSGGIDMTLRVWNIHEQDQMLPIDKKNDAKHHLRNASEVFLATKSNSRGSDSTSASATEHTCSKCKRAKEKAVLPVSGLAITDDSLNNSILQYLLQLPEDDSLQTESDSSKSLPIHYGLFGDDTAMARLLDAEYEANCSSAAWDSALVIDSWRGRVKEAITDAIQNKRLSDFHVSLAPMVSSKTWVETCAAYAEQLKAKKEYSKASVYLLAIHRVADAIKLLLDNGKFRQALVIARSRLPPDDPTIQEILRAWGENSSGYGMISVGAVCLAAAGHWNETARLIVRKQTPARLLLAAQIMASKGKDQSTALLYARESLLLSLTARDWTTSKSVLKSFAELNHFSVLVLVHSSLSNYIEVKNTALEWLKDKVKGSLPMAKDCGNVQDVCDTFETNNSNEENIEETSLPIADPILLNVDLYSALKNDLQVISPNKKEDSLLLAVSSKIALAVASAPSLFSSLKQYFTYDSSYTENHSSVRDAMAFVVQAMALLYNHHIMLAVCKDAESLLLKLCMWLFSDGDLRNSKLLSRPSESIQESIRSYLAAAILFWLEKSDSTNHEVHSQALKIMDILKSDLFSIPSVRSFKIDFQHKVLKDKKIKEEALKGKKEIQDLSGLEHEPNSKIPGESKENSPIFVKDGSDSHSEISDENKENSPISEKDGSGSNSEITDKNKENSPISEKDESESSCKITNETKENSHISERGGSQSNSEITDKNQENLPPSGKDGSKSTETEFERLTLWLERFEEERGKVPNPYLCYGRLLSLLRNPQGKLDETEANALLSSFQKFWDDIESQAAII